MHTIRFAALLAVSLLGACTLIAPSLPFSPTAVASPDAETFLATIGCERIIRSVALFAVDTEYWRIESRDPDGYPLAVVAVGEVPDGFTEVTPLDPTWIEDELFERKGATIVFEAPESEAGLAGMGKFLPSDGGYDWLFGDTKDGPGDSWDSYREFVTDEREVGANACIDVIGEPTG
jgi:hypothetical protein